MGSIVHVEFTADAPEVLSGFYAEVLGWRTDPSPVVPDYHLIDTGPGAGVDGAVMARRYCPQPVVAWAQVADIEATRRLVVAHGGALLGEVKEIPGEGRVCYVSDPTGTVHGLKEPVSAAEVHRV